ncbi:2-C-methyl-D-erythritol 2,4-cyclodiphosphate synthase [Desulfobacterales bacterium HSG16]|nr:2-C-methyl-D-erythritol 2,4-cyclodiphosphate synthase [Desulfobacterales bacterium HSG16]
MRVGQGYDVHKLVEGRKLVLGGITIPFKKGLLGHSDADVLVHAICDALLGAAGMGDIGLHFPDTSPEFKDFCSLNLLKETCRMLSEKGYSIVNIDSTIFAQAPKIAPYREQMVDTVSDSAGISGDRVNIKATTTEGLGMIGKGEGIAAMSVALIE